MPATSHSISTKRRFDEKPGEFRLCFYPVDRLFDEPVAITTSPRNLQARQSGGKFVGVSMAKLVERDGNGNVRVLADRPLTIARHDDLLSELYTI